MKMLSQHLKTEKVTKSLRNYQHKIKYDNSKECLWPGNTQYNQYIYTLLVNCITEPYWILLIHVTIIIFLKKDMKLKIKNKFKKKLNKKECP